MPKSTENTVFVRFVPTPSQKLPRHQLESIFSEVGPIKKTSWIQSDKNTSKGYGFVKYLSNEDAIAASSSLNGSKISVDGNDYKVLVELATLEQDQSRGSKTVRSEQDKPSKSIEVDDGEETTTTNNEFLKKKSRIIIRNLSFYAKEHHIRSVLQKKFGEVVEVHLPRVQSNLHVGFCFVTFANPEDAQKAIETKNLEIQKRAVSMDWSLPKSVHQQQKSLKAPQSDKHSENPKDITDPSRGNHQSDSDDNDNEEEAAKHSEEDDDSDDDDVIDDEDSVASEKSDSALKEGRTIFLRNLPFDTTRKDLFELFAKFGYIESIYLVKDKATDMLKGTAFITYKRSRCAESAVAAASGPKEGTSSLQGGTQELNLKGRKILANMAVDKETADTFASKEHNAPSADRRNMYLQAEARVESTPTDGSDKANTWEDIPEQDQKKRQTALKDKTTKLQSPIFFINPFRLSVRNVAKHVDEVQLRTLCEIGAKRGLQAGLVSAKDYIAHLKAQGEMSTRDILEMVQEKSKKSEDIITPWDDSAKSKDYIPSVFIDRDFGSGSSKSKATSRGFGFIEFTHHVHALACLRELNNNPVYSKEYVAGGRNAAAAKKNGKKAGAGKASRDLRIPRLIVDFTVENRVKAKKQQERRLHQQLNNDKQRQAVQEVTKTDEDNGAKKRSRGAIQRAKKKQKKAENKSSGKTETPKKKRDTSNTPQDDTREKQLQSRKRTKAQDNPSTRPPAESTRALTSSESIDARTESSKKRWFE